MRKLEPRKGSSFLIKMICNFTKSFTAGIIFETAFRIIKR